MKQKDKSMNANAKRRTKIKTRKWFVFSVIFLRMFSCLACSSLYRW
jgi:hypothetical protein